MSRFAKPPRPSAEILTWIETYAPTIGLPCFPTKASVRRERRPTSARRRRVNLESLALRDDRRPQHRGAKAFASSKAPRLASRRLFAQPG